MYVHRAPFYICEDFVHVRPWNQASHEHQDAYMHASIYRCLIFERFQILVGLKTNIFKVILIQFFLLGC